MPRPRRSLLFMPGSNPRALEKARALPADGLIFDLEDAVAPEAKEERAGGRRGGPGRGRLWRARAGVAGQRARHAVGACRSRGRCDDADRRGAVAEGRERRPGGADRVAARRVRRSASGSRSGACSRRRAASSTPARSRQRCPRLAALVLGTVGSDQRPARAHDPRSPAAVTSLSLAILAARAHGLAVLDGVHLDLADDEGFAAACRQGRELGFDGKTLIHPKQIDAANAAFAPTPEEVEWSRRIIAAHSEAAGRGQRRRARRRQADRKPACRERPPAVGVRRARSSGLRREVKRCRGEPALTLPGRGLIHSGYRPRTARKSCRNCCR